MLTHLDVKQFPGWIVGVHQLCKRGSPCRIFQGNSNWVGFKPTPKDALVWPELSQIDYVVLQYAKKEMKHHVNVR